MIFPQPLDVELWQPGQFGTRNPSRQHERDRTLSTITACLGTSPGGPTPVTASAKSPPGLQPMERPKTHRYAPILRHCVLSMRSGGEQSLTHRRLTKSGHHLSVACHVLQMGDNCADI